MINKPQVGELVYDRFSPTNNLLVGIVCKVYDDGAFSVKWFSKRHSELRFFSKDNCTIGSLEDLERIKSI